MPAVTVRIKKRVDLLGTPMVEFTDDHIEDLQLNLSLYDLGENFIQLDRDFLFPPYGQAMRAGNLAEVIVHAISEDPLHSFFLEEVEAVLAGVPADDVGGRGSRWGGPGLLYYLSRARFLPWYGTVINGVTTWSDATPGQVMIDMLTADQNTGADGVNALSDLTWDFSATLDSDGNAWDTFDGEFDVAVGTDYLTAFGNLQLFDDLDLVMTPDFVLHAYKSFGRTLGGADWATGVVRFQRGGPNIGGTVTTGGNILTDQGAMKRRNRGKRRASHILMQGRSDFAGDVDNYVLVERQGHDPDVDEVRVLYHEYPSNRTVVLTRVGRKILREGEVNNQNISEMEVMPGDDETGENNEIGVGLYLPGPEGTNGHYWLGDRPTTHTGISHHDYNNATPRIIALRIKLAEATGDSSEEEKQRSLHTWVQLGVPGNRSVLALTDSTVPGPSRHTHPPNPELCRIGIPGVTPVAEASGGAIVDGNPQLPLTIPGGHQDRAIFAIVRNTSGGTISLSWQPHATDTGSREALELVATHDVGSDKVWVFRLFDPTPTISGASFIHSSDTAIQEKWITWWYLTGVTGSETPVFNTGSDNTAEIAIPTPSGSLPLNAAGWFQNNQSGMTAPTPGGGQTQTFAGSLDRPFGQPDGEAGGGYGASNPTWTFSSAQSWQAAGIAVLGVGGSEGDCPDDVGHVCDVGTSTRAARCDHVHAHGHLSASETHYHDASQIEGQLGGGPHEDSDHTAFVLNTDGGKEVVNTVAASGSSETLDLADGNWHDVTLTANCTFTFAGATNGVGCSFVLLLRQDGTGSRTVTWPGSVVWPGGTAPVLSTDANAVDVISFLSNDSGTTWFGAYLGVPSGGAPGGLGTAFTVDAGTPIYDDTTDPDVVEVSVSAKWGIDTSGDPYFNSAGVTSGEEAALMRDPDSGAYFLRPYNF